MDPLSSYDDDDENGFTICGFQSPQKIQWWNGKGKSLKLSDILSIIEMKEPRILEIALSWDNGYQRTTILNITKDIHHQYCSFNTDLHQPNNLNYQTTSDTDDIDDDDYDDDYDDDDDDDQKLSILSNLANNDDDDIKQPQPSMNLQLPTLNNVERNSSSPQTYKECIQRFDHIPVINDHIKKQKANNQNKPSLSSSSSSSSSNSNQLPSKIDLKLVKTLTAIGSCLALEELFSILCWKCCPAMSIKLQFADLVTIQNTTQLILKYRSYFKLDSLSCIWYHGVFLHQFPLSSSRKSLFRGGSGSGSNDDNNSNSLSFSKYRKYIESIPSITYSLAWPSSRIITSAAPLKLALSSILSEILIFKEHDIIIHFPIQYIYECYYVINDIITYKSYFPYCAFNFFNIHNNLHNFDFDKYYNNNINYNKNGKNNKYKNGYNHNKSTSSSFSWFRKNKSSHNNKSLLVYDTSIRNVRNLKEDEIVCKTDLNWLSSHIHQLFCFTSVSCVRFKNSPNDEFRKILGAHNVKEWSGRLSWDPKGKSQSKSHHKSSHHKSHKYHKSSHYNYKHHLLKQPSIDWTLWQLARIDPKSRHFQSCIYNNNIGLAPRNGGWLISTRELHPPYRIKGRFFTGDKHGILSIYIRCSSIEYPCNNELPSFGIGIHIGNEKLKIVTYRLNINNNKEIKEVCDIGTCIDNGYDFQIIDRGVMYPIVCQVERTGKDGKGDNFPQGKNLQIPYSRDSSQWMYHIVFVNSSNEWIIIDRLIVDEKK